MAKPASAKIAIVLFMLAILSSLYVFSDISPQWREQSLLFNVYMDPQGELVYKFKGQEVAVGEAVPYEMSPLRQAALDQLEEEPALTEQWVLKTVVEDGQAVDRYVLLQPKFHLGWWSLLPAAISIALCLLTREPVTALSAGIVVGAFMLGRFDLSGEVLIPSLASTGAASLLLLYLWLLGGLMGIWSKTGAAQAFAEFMTQHFVRGPRTAKLVAWLLGVIFFQGGTVSTVLVGTTVRPLADKENVSHEELSYIVDSTASPIAVLLAFNAWPAYVQALIFVPGVAVLATEADRLAFFFSSIPFSFYAIFAITGTLLLCLDITGFSGPGIRRAMKRSRLTGQLNAPGAQPLASQSHHSDKDPVPAGYRPHVLEFFAPLLVLIAIAIGTFIHGGSPKVLWAFGIALLLAALIAAFRGMSLFDLIDGISDGLKSVVLASVILMLAITVGGISKETGGGLFLVAQLGEQIPYWLLPLFLQVLTMVIAFSTGTSWGTYAITFPLAMPLAWAVAQAGDVSQPELYLSVCLATVLNGSVYGDQCSPISDTTILSSMTTGADLMDHVKTQLVPASYAAGLAAMLWTGTVVLFA